MTPLERIRQLYYETSAETIADDFDEAITLLKQMPTEEAREQAAVYMEGLAEMRTEWHGRSARGPRSPRRR